MLAPDTVPLRGNAPGSVDSVIVPVSFDVACVHCSTNVPVKEPPYVPRQVPESPAVEVAGDVVRSTEPVGLSEVDARAVWLNRAADAAPAPAELPLLAVVLFDEHATINTADMLTTVTDFNWRM